MPVILEAASVLAALTYPNRWGQRKRSSTKSLVLL